MICMYTYGAMWCIDKIVFSFTDGTPNTQINKIACHPTLPIIVTAHEDKYIRMYDSNTGTQVVFSQKLSIFDRHFMTTHA